VSDFPTCLSENNLSMTVVALIVEKVNNALCFAILLEQYIYPASVVPGCGLDFDNFVCVTREGKCAPWLAYIRRWVNSVMRGCRILLFFRANCDKKWC
jgi:hypothetical protein